MYISETQREIIMAHTIQAGEILQMHFLKKKKIPLSYTSVFGPGGPNLFTGPLKAASYLLLDNTIDHIIYIIEKKDTNEIDEQITYAKIIKNIQHFSTIIFSKKSSLSVLIKRLEEAQKKQKIAMIFLGKASINISLEKAQKADELRARALLLKKEYTPDPSRIGNAFSTRTKKNKRKPEIIGYVNTADV